MDGGKNETFLLLALLDFHPGIFLLEGRCLPVALLSGQNDYIHARTRSRRRGGLEEQGHVSFHAKIHSRASNHHFRIHAWRRREKGCKPRLAYRKERWAHDRRQLAGHSRERSVGNVWR